MSLPDTSIRASLVTALHSELVGPFDPNHPNEILETSPSRWYLTGFLAPQGGRETDPTDDDELGGGDDQDDEAEASQEPEPKQKSQFPASLGLSIFLPASTGAAETIKVTVTYADYMREERVVDATDKRKKKTLWQRIPRAPQSVEITLDERTIEKSVFTIASQSESFDPSCSGKQLTSANNCEVDIDIKCPWNGAFLKQEGHGKWSQDGNAGEALLQVTAEGASGAVLCASTYDAKYERVR